MESALDAVTAMENSRLQGKSLDLYRHLRAELLVLPAESDDELNVAHKEAAEKALAYFAQHSILDENGQHQRDLEVSNIPVNVRWRNVIQSSMDV